MKKQANQTPFSGAVCGRIRAYSKTLSAVTLALLATAAMNANAADLTWNNGASTGNWNLTDANWTGSVWNNAAPDNAIFDATTFQMGAINLTVPITAGSISVGSASQSDPFTQGSLNGGSLQADSVLVNGNNSGETFNNFNILTFDVPTVSIAGDVSVGLFSTLSFLTYAGRGGPDNAPRTPMESIFRRASGTSDTFALATNYLHQGVYILHGEADDNVPVTQARSMRDVLAGFHKDYDYHEQKGAGHWWDSSDEPGAECMDWPPMYDLFSRRSIPPVDSIRKVQFTTVNPGVSSSCDWLAIEAQTRPLEPSSVEIQADPWARRFIGKTYNVARLRFDLKPIQKDSQFKVELDGQTLDKIPWPPSNQIWLQRVDSQWTHTESARPLTEKGPHRNGPFKDAFRHRMIMVYATQGTSEENAWAFAKARFDAETFYYRGNGSIEIVPDIEFNAGNQPDRSVILYGNADSNSAWESLLGKSPIQVNRGSVSVGGQSRTGESLGCLFLQPRPGSDRACVAVVSGTGLVGMRATDRMPYLAPGVGFPDFTLFSPEVYDQGLKGVLCAGFFGSNWNLTGGEAVWRE